MNVNFNKDDVNEIIEAFISSRGKDNRINSKLPLVNKKMQNIFRKKFFRSENQRREEFNEDITAFTNMGLTKLMQMESFHGKAEAYLIKIISNELQSYFISSEENRIKTHLFYAVGKEKSPISPLKSDEKKASRFEEWYTKKAWKDTEKQYYRPERSHSAIEKHGQFVFSGGLRRSDTVLKAEVTHKYSSEFFNFMNMYLRFKILFLKYRDDLGAKVKEVHFAYNKKDTESGSFQLDNIAAHGDSGADFESRHGENSSFEPVIRSICLEKIKNHLNDIGFFSATDLAVCYYNLKGHNIEDICRDLKFLAEKTSDMQYRVKALKKTSVADKNNENLRKLADFAGKDDLPQNAALLMELFCEAIEEIFLENIKINLQKVPE